MPAAMFGNIDAIDAKNFGFSVNSDFSATVGNGTGTEAERGDDVCCLFVFELDDFCLVVGAPACGPRAARGVWLWLAMACFLDGAADCPAAGTS